MKAWFVIVLCVMGVWHSVQGQVANDDFYTAPAGSAFAVSAPGVLTNDTGRQFDGDVGERAGERHADLECGWFVYLHANEQLHRSGRLYL